MPNKRRESDWVFVSVNASDLKVSHVSISDSCERLDKFPLSSVLRYLTAAPQGWVLDGQSATSTHIVYSLFRGHNVKDRNLARTKLQCRVDLYEKILAATDTNTNTNLYACTKDGMIELIQNECKVENTTYTVFKAVYEISRKILLDGLNDNDIQTYMNSVNWLKGTLAINIKKWKGQLAPNSN
jgi:hypothetical protein